VPGDVFVGEAVRFARRHQVVAPHEEYVGIAPGLHLTRDDEGHLHVVRVGAAQRHGVADLPAILVHEDFADDGGALFFAGRLALLFSQRVTGDPSAISRAAPTPKTGSLTSRPVENHPVIAVHAATPGILSMSSQ